MDSTSLIIEGLASPETLARGIPMFAQFLLFLVEFMTPALFAWNVFDAGTENMMTMNRPKEENFDFIVGMYHFLLYCYLLYL